MRLIKVSTTLFAAIAFAAAAFSLAVRAQAQTFDTLVSFDGTNGYGPYAGLTQATDGNFYGTTNQGGAGIGCTLGCGTLFKITPAGALTTLHSFGGSSGIAPYSAPVQATNGDFYGTTAGGPGRNGFGTIYKITAEGELSTLEVFDYYNGGNARGSLIQATDGSLYGTSIADGINGGANIFRVTPSGTLTTVADFANVAGAGSIPVAGLVQVANGDFYGTTEAGGTGNGACGAGCGTVFKVTPGGALTTIYSFAQLGYGPTSPLVQGTDGNFYGTTVYYGNGFNGCCGTIFKITPTGTMTMLYWFSGSNGAYPYAGLIQATDGNFYGTTELGGANNLGTIFQITPQGTLTTLHSFDSTDGAAPYSGLIQDTDGSFYGTTSAGGTNNDGTIFKLSMGFGPFVKTLPTSGKVGATIEILGTDLTGSTVVSFNGKPAAFSVVSATQIRAQVPESATTGTLKVTTPTGVLLSNLPFRIVP
jgi:uncharacterized repeat protein (TIGR03803 family)